MFRAMPRSPASALAELYKALLSEGPLDVPACRRLALRATGPIKDPSAAEILHEELCAIIDQHADDPDHAQERFAFLRPAIESLASAPH